MSRAGDSLPKIAARAAEALRPVIDAQIGARVNPYGEPWAPPSPRSKGTPEEVALEIEGLSIRASVGHEQRRKHMVVPVEELGLPDTWREVLDTAVVGVLGEVLK
jgi:hypothetical protein